MSHSSIDRALIGMGIDDNIRAYIISDLSSSKNNIRVGKANTRDIHIREGVKQGDPLSPIPFNLVIDELLDEINRSPFKGSITDESLKLGAMAFADDLIVLLDKENHEQVQLDRNISFLKRREMEVNTSKSRCISAVVSNKKLVIRSKPFLKVNEQNIGMVTAISTMRYL